MTLNTPPKVVFKQKKRNDFEKELLKKVENYFKQKGISKKGNSTLLIKGILFFLLVLGSYAAIYLVPPTLPWLLLAFCSLGFFSVAMVLNLGHDAMHGAASSNAKINQLLGYTSNMAGMSSYIWKLKHNLAHHSFTNVSEVDYNVAENPLLRLNPTYPRKKFHKYQHIYGPFLMALTTINLSLVADFQMLKQTRFANKVVQHSRSQIIRIILLKISYQVYTLILPLIFVQAPIWMILVAFLCYHITAGLFVAAVLVPAHFHPDTHFHTPDEEGAIDQSWFAHQLDVTVDFSANTPLVGWLTGGLNYHIVHHFFPNICHVHYGPLTKIVKETAEAHGKRYLNKSWGRSLVDIGRFLKELGSKDDLPTYFEVTQ